MRNIIIDNIFELMKKNKKIFFLTADMGINLVEKFEHKFPERFLNVGIAEQNIIGIASGLSNCGYIPFVYTISNFLIHRCFEQIRNDISLHKKKIVLVGTSCGFDNSPLGPTHHMVDDWGHIKILPEFQVYCPSSNEYSKNITKKIIKIKKPVFLRIPKGDYNDIKTNKDIVHFKKNREKLLVTYGNMTKECFPIYKNSEISLLVLNKLHPLKSNISKILTKYNKIYVAEDHFSSSGLYGSLCELMINFNKKINIFPIGPIGFNLKVGETPEFLMRQHKIDKDSIQKKIKS